MRRCHGCRRHVRCGESACPFCDVTLDVTCHRPVCSGAPIALTAAFLLSLVGCVDKTSTKDATLTTQGDSQTSGPVTSSSVSTTTTSGDDSLSDTDSFSGGTYAGPVTTDDWSTTGWTDVTTDESTSTSTSTTRGTGTGSTGSGSTGSGSGSTGTGTGSTGSTSV